MKLRKIICLGVLICATIICTVFASLLISNDITVNVAKAQSDSLDSYRKVNISDDNIGYKNVVSTVIPYNLPMTSVSIGSTDEDAYTKDSQLFNGYPAYHIVKASNFAVSIKYADKVAGSTLYSYSTGERKQHSIIKDTYTLSVDTWGENYTSDSTQLVYVNGVKVVTGKIATGALIVQTSVDGSKWVNADKAHYANGLYTTDVLNYYHGQTKEYTLDGADIKKGVYVSVSFLYEVKRVYVEYYTTEERYWWQLGLGDTHTVVHEDEHTKYLNICEQYRFFVVDDNTSVVTYNNLTTQDKSEIVKVPKPSSQNLEEYNIESEQYDNYLMSLLNQITPTMNSGDMTATGFRINVTANPNLLVKLKRNGKDYPLPVLQFKNEQYYYEITEYGKYDITIQSHRFSKIKKETTIYVDSVDTDTAYKRYFGEQILIDGCSFGDMFINYSPLNEKYSNKRIFDAYSKVPVFLEKLLLYLQPQEDTNVLPLYGMITNKTTGQTVPFNGPIVQLEDYGEYEIILYTNKNYYKRAVLKDNSVSISGDVRVYKFNFKIVGKYSDKTINEQLLETGSFNDFSVVSPSDYIPRFYGVTRTSANKGKIIVAFSSKKAALEYAKSVAWSEIELYYDSQGNPYWMVPNLDNLGGSKIESNSGWNNATIVNEYAAKLVEELYFDLTKTSSYLTLEQSMEDLLNSGTELSNLHLADLKKSVIIWYDKEQRENAIVKGVTVGDKKIIKFIGKQNIAVLSKGSDGTYSKVVQGVKDYVFIRDALGLDSFRVKAIDTNGKTYNINYKESLYGQLKNLKVKSGLIKIEEVNVYGDTLSSYYVYYIEEGIPNLEVNVEADGTAITINKGNVIAKATYNSFTIKQVERLQDPYTFLKVKKVANNATQISYYFSYELDDYSITEKGEYELSFIDRFGNSLNISFKIV